MKRQNGVHWSWWVTGGVILLAAVFVSYKSFRPKPRPPDVSGWDVSRLVEELRKRGLDVGFLPDVPSNEMGLTDTNAVGGGVLIDRRVDQSGGVLTAGTVWVVCENLPHQGERRFLGGEEVGRIDHFHFRGDVDFFKRIRDLLQQ